MASEDATEPVSPEQMAVRPATGAQILDYLRTPAAIERRHETILQIGRTLGLDDAVRIMERSRRKEYALWTLFEHDELPPQARLLGEQMIGQWLSHVEDWVTMSAAEAARRGCAVEDLQKTPSASPPIVPDDAASPLAPEQRLGGFLLGGSDERSLGGTHEDTDSFFTYTKFRLNQGGDDDQ